MAEIDKLFLEALNAYENQEYELAISMLERCLEKSPNFTKAKSKIGEIYAKTEKYEKALEIFNEIIKNEKGVPIEAHLWRVRIYFKMERYADVVEGYSNIERDKIKITYEDLCNLGYAYYKLGDYPNSMKHFSRAIQMGEKSPLAFYNLGQLYYKLGDFGNALNNFEKAYLFMDKYPDLNNKLGVLNWVIKKDSEEAEKYFRKALMFDANYVPAIFNYIKILHSVKNDKASAREYLEKLKKICNNNEKIQSLESLFNN